MLPRRLPIQLGARLAIGLLAAVYLWNLKIVSNNLFLPGDGGVWNPLGSFESLHNDTGIELASASINTTVMPPEHRVPGFIILGAQKSGTQALRSYMKQHPLVHFPRGVVEAHFFDWGYRKRKSTQENLDTYTTMLNRKHGDCRDLGCVAGESTPSYLFVTKRVPKRIKDLCPWAKFIVILRDPVKRAYSQCNMLIEKHEVKTSFDEHVQFDLKQLEKAGFVSNRSLTIQEEEHAWNEYHRYRRIRKLMLGRGLYEIQLRLWFRYFPRDQFLILKSEELDLNRTATMKRVFEFIGVPDIKLYRDKKVHKRKYENPMSNETRTALHEFYQPYNKRLQAILGPEWKDVWQES